LAGGTLKTYDYVVANPPFSDKRWSTGLDPANDPHQRFQPFGMNAHFTAWRRTAAAELKGLRAGCHPKEIIVQLSEGLLAHYNRKPLIDRYDVYQHLMDYWAETMQDDVYLIAADGWKAETTRILVKDKKGKEKDKGWTCDLIPKALIVARYFAPAQAAIDRLAAEAEGVGARLAELEEEHGGEDGAFAELDKVNKAEVSRRLKELRTDRSDPTDPADDETPALRAWLALSDAEADLKKRQKAAEAWRPERTDPGLPV